MISDLDLEAFIFLQTRLCKSISLLNTDLTILTGPSRRRISSLQVPKQLLLHRHPQHRTAELPHRRAGLLNSISFSSPTPER